MSLQQQYARARQYSSIPQGIRAHRKARAKYRAAHRAELRLYSSQYRKLHPDKNSACAMKYFASKLKRTPRWVTPGMLKDMQFFYTIRSEMKSPQDWQVDHIIPLQGKLVSGLHVPGNLRLIKRKENRDKSNRFDLNIDGVICPC